MDTAGFHSQEGWLEEGFWGTETFVANGEAASGAGAAKVVGAKGATGAATRGAATGTAWPMGSTNPSSLRSSENPSREIGLSPRSVATRSPKAAVSGPATVPSLT